MFFTIAPCLTQYQVPSSPKQRGLKRESNHQDIPGGLERLVHLDQVPPTEECSWAAADAAAKAPEHWHIWQNISHRSFFDSFEPDLSQPKPQRSVSPTGEQLVAALGIRLESPAPLKPEHIEPAKNTEKQALLDEARRIFRKKKIKFQQGITGVKLRAALKKAHPDTEWPSATEIERHIMTLRGQRMPQHSAKARLLPVSKLRSAARMPVEDGETRL